ncbi:MAG: hypothetical protein IJ219_11595 [Bacteroidaceae bacterium]|nr:hypothetical protein [Bacteroidaceae bacterium]MBQ9171009.1 hypothetical protein [Bacteroidaceae bacterium]MBQ9295547.1 hypothetical protein [Bacteroidaceae bacterium]
MNKKDYSKPVINVDIVLQTQMLCSSVITKVEGDGFGYGGSGTGPARAPQCDDWDVWGDD